MSEAADTGAESSDCPLYVDLDGSLVVTDTLWESLFTLLRTQPHRLLAAPLWLSGGRAHFKQRLAEQAMPDPASLPYRADLLEFLEAERGRGRRVVLATGSDERVARAVAAHLGLFDDVIASDGVHNRAGAGKVAAIRAHGESDAFDYVGNSAADLPVWQAARRAYAVAPPAGVLRRLERHKRPERVFPAASGGVGAVFAAIRPIQWAKNLLVFVPLALTPDVAADPARIAAALAAFVALCMAASAGYVLNDLLDLAADRDHPVKQRRPFASGALQLSSGVVLFAGLVFAGFAVAIAGTAPAFVPLLAVYLALTLGYSLWIKRLLLLDVMLLAGLYTLRVIAGAAAVEIVPTPWLLAFSMFIFLSLAFAKRYSELMLVAERQRTEALGRAYRVEDLDLVLILGATSGYLSVLVLCLYINSDLVRELYRQVEALWLLVPILLYWVSRIWFLAKRGDLPGDPVAFAVRDPVSLVTGALMAVVIVVAVL